MRKLGITIAGVFLILCANAQFTVTPGNWKQISINDRAYKIFVPADYATGSNYYLHVAFYGNGTTDVSMLDDEEPGNLVSATGANWNGEIYLNNMSTAKFIIFGIPNYGNFVDVYAQAIDSVFKVLGNKVDRSNSNYFSCSGFSGGVGRMWSYLTNQNNQAPGPNRLLFQNTISMSGVWVNVNVAARSAQGRHWVWYSSLDPNGGTPAGASQALYDNISGAKRITDYQVDCHCGTVWDSCMSIAGTDIPNGGTAVTNRWRWLVSANDTLILQPLPIGDGPIPIERNPVVTAVRISPNPAGQMLNLSWEIDKTSPAEVRIIDIRGTVMYKKEMLLAKGYRNDQLPIHSLATGVYYLQVFKEKKLYTVPFVKQ